MTSEPVTSDDIAAAMQALGLNQPRFAAVIGVDQGTVSKWVNGKTRPSAPAKKLIARLIDEHRGVALRQRSAA